MKKTNLVPIVIALLLVGGMASQLAAQQCQLGFEGIDKGESARGSMPTFSALSTEDLSFSFQVSPMSATGADRVISIRLRMPGGFLYQDLDQAVARKGVDGKKAARETTRRVAGYPFPMPVVSFQEASNLKLENQGGGGWPFVVIKVPVAGTSIVQSSLYGEWIAEPYLDGRKETLCGPALRFRIVE